MHVIRWSKTEKPMAITTVKYNTITSTLAYYLTNQHYSPARINQENLFISQGDEKKAPATSNT